VGELDQAVEPKPSGLSRLIRLEPNFAARLGIPFEDLRRVWRGETVKRVEVNGLEMAYRVEGRGRPVVLIGGGLGGMSVWSEISPTLAENHQVTSIDLIGFGQSARIPDASMESYGWETHTEYLGGCIEALGFTEPVTILSHGWNSIPALAWAQQNEDRVRAIGYVDAVLRPMAWPEADEGLREVVKLARSGDEDYFLRTDQYVDDAVDRLVSPPVDASTRAAYRAAAGSTPADRLAHMAAVANIPLGGQPAETSTLMRGCYQWLKGSNIPKLLVLGKPGYVLTERARKLALRIPHQRVVTVDGVHLLPQSAPDSLGQFVGLWLGTI
jgi:haloalkane dehalogenase